MSVQLWTAQPGPPSRCTRAAPADPGLAWPLSVLQSQGTVAESREGGPAGGLPGPVAECLHVTRQWFQGCDLACCPRSLTLGDGWVHNTCNTSHKSKSIQKVIPPPKKKFKLDVHNPKGSPSASGSLQFWELDSQPRGCGQGWGCGQRLRGGASAPEAWPCAGGVVRKNSQGTSLCSARPLVAASGLATTFSWTT